MKSALYFALLPSLFSAYLANAAVSSAAAVKKTSNLPTVPNKFIIEVDELSSVPNKRSFTRVSGGMTCGSVVANVPFAGSLSTLFMQNWTHATLYMK